MGNLKRLSDAIGRLLNRKDFTGCYYFIAKHSGKCLDMADWSKDYCGSIKQYSLHGCDKQL